MNEPVRALAPSFIDPPPADAPSAPRVAGIAPHPSGAFVAAAWAALIGALLAFGIGLFNATMALDEKGFYATLLPYGLFAAVSLQKSVRDRHEGRPVTAMYLALCWASLALAGGLLSIGLWNATLAPSEKGFYGLAFALALFAAVTVQKNVRDAEATMPA